MNISTSFIIEYPVGLDSRRIKGQMYLFTKMMLNGFAKYELIVKVYLTWDKVYVFVEDHVKEFGISDLGSEPELVHLNSYQKGDLPEEIKSIWT